MLTSKEVEIIGEFSDDIQQMAGAIMELRDTIEEKNNEIEELKTQLRD